MTLTRVAALRSTPALVADALSRYGGDTVTVTSLGGSIEYCLEAAEHARESGDFESACEYLMDAVLLERARGLIHRRGQQQPNEESQNER